MNLLEARANPPPRPLVPPYFVISSPVVYYF